MSELDMRSTSSMPLPEHVERTTVFPLHELPVEIVEAIIEIASYEDVEKRGQNLTRLSIVRVCRSWREVALGMPCLWTTIAFPHEAIADDRLRIVAQDLRYGEKYGLDINMNPFVHNFTGFAAGFDTFVELVLQRQLNWRSIQVDSLPRGTLPVIVKRLKDLSFPRLLKVDVDCSAMSGSHDVGGLAAILCKGAGELHHIRLKYVELWPVMFAPMLRSMELDDCVLPRLPTFFNALKALDNLHTLSITAALPYTDFHDTIRMKACTVVTLPSLRILSLGVYEDDHDSCFVQHLDCPVLDHLQLWMIVKACGRCDQRSSIEWYQFTRLPRAIAKNSWPITTLDLGGIHCDFSDISRAMPYVSRLRIQMPFHAVDILESPPSSQYGSKAVFPNLLELAIWRADDTVVLERALSVSDASSPFGRVRRVYAPRGQNALNKESAARLRDDNEAARQKLEKKFHVFDGQPPWALRNRSRGF